MSVNDSATSDKHTYFLWCGVTAGIALSWQVLILIPSIRVSIFEHPFYTIVTPTIFLAGLLFLLVTFSNPHFNTELRLDRVFWRRGFISAFIMAGVTSLNLRLSTNALFSQLWTEALYISAWTCLTIYASALVAARTKANLKSGLASLLWSMLCLWVCLPVFVSIISTQSLQPKNATFFYTLDTKQTQDRNANSVTVTYRSNLAWGGNDSKYMKNAIIIDRGEGTETIEVKDHNDWLIYNWNISWEPNNTLIIKVYPSFLTRTPTILSIPLP